MGDYYAGCEGAGETLGAVDVEDEGMQDIVENVVCNGVGLSEIMSVYIQMELDWGKMAGLGEAAW